MTREVELMFTTLKEAVQNDPEYAWGWQCNLAMTLLDAGVGLNSLQANKAANSIMSHLFDALPLNPEEVQVGTGPNKFIRSASGNRVNDIPDLPISVPKAAWPFPACSALAAGASTTTEPEYVHVPLDITDPAEVEALQHSSFKLQLEKLINRNSMENGSDTPDYILAQFLAGCLTTYNAALKERERWFGRAIGESIGTKDGDDLEPLAP